MHTVACLFADRLCTFRHFGNGGFAADASQWVENGSPTDGSEIAVSL
jgi:hypothetical protein